VDDRHLGAYALLAQTTLSMQTDPESDFEQVKITVQQAIDVFEDVGDESGLAEACLLLGKFETWLGRSAAADAAFAEAAAHARRAGDRPAESRSLAWLGVTLPHNDLPARVAIDRANEILESAADDRTVQATLLTCRANLFAMQGRFDEARRDFAAGRDLLQELGAMLDWAGTASNGGTINLLAGAPDAAEDLLRGALEVLHGMGETGYTSTLQAQLAQALYVQERYDEAQEATELSERAAARDDLDSQVRWRCVRAKLLARQGKTSAAETMAREATKLVEHTDMADLYADALSDLAEVYGMAERSEEETACLQEALRVYEARENLVGADRARSLLDAAQRP
jgi:tetratricopeptide (TPR) repeat protein